MSFDHPKFFEKAVHFSPSSVVITDLEGNIQYVNPKFEALTGYTLDEVIGKNPRVLNSGYSAPGEYREMLHQARSGGQGKFPWEFLTLSMPSWNMVFSLILAGLWIAALRLWSDDANVERTSMGESADRLNGSRRSHCRSMGYRTRRRLPLRRYAGDLARRPCRHRMSPPEALSAS